MIRSLACACAAVLVSASASAQPSGARTTTIHGRVIDDGAHVALRNARVAFDGDDVRPVATDGEGRFTITGPVGGTLVASKAGFARAAAPAVDGSDIALPRGAVITGRLLDEFGVPVPLVTIVAQRVDRAGGRRLATTSSHVETDDTGAYRLFDLAAGDYVVGMAGGRTFGGGGAISVPRAIDGPPRRYFPSAAALDEATVLHPGAGEEIAGVDMTLAGPPGPFPTPPRPPANGASSATPTATVRGRVADADGIPARAARVELASSRQLFSPMSVTADNDGAYEFSGVEPGEYFVSVTTTRFERVSFGQRRAGDRGDVLSVKRGAAVDHVDVTIPRGSRISGRILDQYGDPIANVNVRAAQIRARNGRRHLVRAPGVAGQQTNDRGEFRLFGVAPGRYLIEATVGEAVTGWEINDLPGFQTSYFPGTAQPSQAQPVEAADDQDALNVEFALARGATGTISGRVMTASGAPFDGALHIIPTSRSHAVVPGNFPSRATASNGAFHFAGLPPGEYVLQAAASPADSASEGEFGTQFVTVDGGAAEGVVLRMSAGSTVAGRVTFEGEAPATTDGFELSTAVTDPDFASLADNRAARAEPGADWTFAMRGLNGPRRLIANQPAGWMVKAILANGIDVTDAVLQFGRQDESIRDLEVVMTAQVTALSVTVDGQGGASGDDLVMVFSTDRSRWYPGSRFLAILPASDGAATLRGLAPGEYFVAAIDRRSDAMPDGEQSPEAMLEALTSTAAHVTLGPGQQAAVTVSLAR
jgi:carboxypeptidase family protein